MSYRIAAASSDGVNVNVTFREADRFYIYEVDEKRDITLADIRSWTKDDQENSCPSGVRNGVNCQSGTGGGCGGAGDAIPKLELLNDCRCFICAKIGFKAVKYLERKAVVTFELEGAIRPAVEKITEYFDRTDHHKSLRGLAKENLTEEHSL